MGAQAAVDRLGRGRRRRRGGGDERTRSPPARRQARGHDLRRRRRGRRRCRGGAGGPRPPGAGHRVRGGGVIAPAGEATKDYLREIGAIPVVYGEGVADRVRAAAGGRVDAVFDVAGKTPVEELIGLVAEPSQVLSIANFAAGQAGARTTGGGADSHPEEALAEAADLLAQNKLVIKVQTVPFDRAAEAYRTSQSGHVRGKLVLVP